MKKTHLSWQDIEELVDALVGKLDGEFDALLCITRGGMVPACLISERIDQRNILAAAVMFYTGIGKTLDKPVFLQFPADPYLAGKRVLVVDDVWDSGRTVVAVKQRIEQVGGVPSVAVLHYKPTQSAFPDLKPDYYGATVDGWIVYPWDPARLAQLAEARVKAMADEGRDGLE
ncbi:MAG: phosphoribosyltransferase family protein [Clostridia bacterium]|nr:phosphoribosyltransferase family protein [Clostridia bacterium]